MHPGTASALRRPLPRPSAQTGADVLADSLISAGARVLFGLPGDTSVGFYDALYARSEHLTHVLARDERDAAAMADAYARVSGRIGFVEVSSGGGVGYVIGGLGEAYAASVPILVVSSDIHSSSSGTGAITEIDQIAMFSGCTKWRVRVRSALAIPEAVAAAITEIRTGRPGPAAIVVPEDVLDERVVANLRARIDRPAIRGANDACSVSPSDLTLAAGWLTDAHQPVIVAGSGVHLSGAWNALERLAVRGSIPVATTIHGKGAIAETHPLALGVVGNNGGRPYANDYVRSADVALLVGTRGNATDTSAWTTPPRDRTVIGIDVSTGHLARNYPGALLLVGDARRVIEQLANAMPDTQRSIVDQRARLVAARSAWERDQSKPQPARGTEIPARDIVRLLLRSAPPDTILVADCGTPTPNVAAYWETARHGRSVIIPRGHGPMGYAIPAAIGAAFARPTATILAITTDGSFAMACGELETAARYRLPILYVQMTNHSLGWIKMLQHLYFEQRYFSVDPGPIDAVAVARACGLAATKARSLDDLQQAVTTFLADRRPTYVDTDVPHVIDVVPPVTAWLEAIGGRRERPVY